MDTLKEEAFKQNLLEILNHFVNEKEMSLGTVYYIFKDVFNDFTNTYNNFIRQQLEKQKQQQKEETQENEEGEVTE